MMTTKTWTTSLAIKRAALIPSAFLLGLIANLTASGSSVEQAEAAVAHTELRMFPLTNIGSAGSDIEIDILIDSVTDLGAYELDIAYDPNVLQY